MGAHQVQDLLVRFPSGGVAQGFLQAAQRAFQSGEIVSTGALGAPPGRAWTVYFASGSRAGVGEVITMRVGTDVDLLSFLSRVSGHTPPISPADALRVAAAQHGAIAEGPGRAGRHRGRRRKEGDIHRHDRLGRRGGRGAGRGGGDAGHPAPPRCADPAWSHDILTISCETKPHGDVFATNQQLKPRSLPRRIF